jgi:hypothetical protein
MKIQSLTFIFILASSLSINTHTTKADNSQKLNIGYIKNLDTTSHACWYWRSGEKDKNKAIFNSWESYGGAAIINLNGRDTKLKTAKPWKVYKLKHVTVKIITTKSASSDGEITDKGTMEISNIREATQSISVEGYCGNETVK